MLQSPSPRRPLVIALHGGTYTSAYFDLPAHSLLARGAALGIPIVAFDRPGYGKTTALDPHESNHAGNAEALDSAIAEFWSRDSRGAVGIVLLGHSIGAAIAFRVATRQRDWPLLGVAASGLGLTLSPAAAASSSHLPPLDLIAMPQVAKDVQMFGPPGTFLPSAREASRLADAPAPRAELLEIASTWPLEAASVLGGVDVPVHYRQGIHDQLWTVNAEEIERFASVCTSAPRVDGSIVLSAGHCIDFHRPGPGFQTEQLGFALRCAGEN